MNVVVRLFCTLLLTVFAVWTQADPSFADSRVALVIGNGAYQNAPRLPNPANDAAAVAAALRRAGFDAILATDLTKAAMDEATIQFARKARTADVAMFYYSGHALQFAGVNYLAPIDIDLKDEADLRRMTRVDEVVADLAQARNLRILVLDSCRDNPLADELKRSIGAARALSLQRGLAKIDSPEGMIVAYATQAGRTAEDGNGKNSPYTTAFLRHIEEKEEIGSIFRRISSDVYETTNHEQLPELSLSFIGEFYLHGRLELTKTNPTPPEPCAMAADHWKSAEAIATKGAFEDHLARFPTCAFAGLAKARLDALNSKAAAIVPPAVPAPAPAMGSIRSQRAVLYEEAPSSPKGQQYVGSVIWRTEPYKASGNQQAGVAVRADVDIPDRKLKMTMSFRRNTDASHTAELTFNLPPDFSGGSISAVPGILMKSNEQAAGTPLASLVVKVTERFFLVGLSNVDADRARNIQLMKERAWFDVPLVYANQRRAIIAIEKGAPGEHAFADAFSAWALPEAAKNSAR
jgi:Caspase domain